MKTNPTRLLLAFCLAFCVLVSVCPDVCPTVQAEEAPPTEESSTTDKPLLIRNRPLFLLQPLNDSITSLAPEPDIGIFFTYFNTAWPWVLGIAAGIGVLQALVGGVQMMLSGSDTGMREGGKTKIMWSLAGLLMVGLAGFILRSLNPLFYN